MIRQGSSSLFTKSVVNVYFFNNFGTMNFLEKERINLCFEEGMDEIGKKLLIEVMGGVFQKQKN